MMKVVHLINLFLFLFCMVLFFFGCKKYDDDSSVILKTPLSRLEGSWQLSAGTWLQAATDSGLQNIVWIELFSKISTYEITNGWTDNNLTTNTTVNGSWTFTNHKDNIQLISTNADTNSISITKLSSDEFHYTDAAGFSYEFTKME